jgi:O-antigen/teichoic acid export membrane protein
VPENYINPITVNLKHKLFGNAAIYLGANLLNAGIPFLLLPILTRVLTPADYGTVAMFGIVLSVFGAFTGLSVHGAIGVRYFQLEKNELAEYVGSCVGILVVSSSALFLLIAIFGSWVAEVSSVPLDWLLVAVPLSGFQFLGNIRLSLWQVAGEARRYGAFQISQSLLNAAMSLILILAVGMAWEGRVLGQTIAVMLFGSIALGWLLRDGLLRLPIEWRIQSWDALKFGIPLIPHVIGGLLIVAADRFVIVRLLDVAQAGIYMVALQVGQALSLVTESFNKAYAPWLMKNLSKPTEALRMTIVRGTYIYFALVLAAAAFFGFLAPILLSFLVGESFRTAGEMVIYIAFGFAFGGCYFMVTNYVFFESKTKFLALVTFFSGITNIPLMFILIDHNGIVGAAQAFMLTNALNFIGTWWLAQKLHPMPWLKALRLTIN